MQDLLVQHLLKGLNRNAVDFGHANNCSPLPCVGSFPSLGSYRTESRHDLIGEVKC